MVYLNRIYTRSGDSGETSLGDGTRVPKTGKRIQAYGAVDEFNSIIGLAITALNADDIAGWLRQIQNDLFDLGADLCVPESESASEQPRLRVSPDHVSKLERWIDAANEDLEPLESFVLPGGSVVAAHLHHARTVCRRAEIAVLHLADDETVNAQVVIYLNRLSDLLFVLARKSNNNGADDVKWAPGQGGGLED